MICEKCGKEHNGSFGSGRFCSRSCANSHIHSKDWKENISKSLQNHYNKHPELTFLKNTKHICKFCGSSKYEGDHSVCNLHPSINWYKKLIPFGFDFTKIGTPGFKDEYFKAISLLRYEYEVNKLSPKAIFEKYNLSEYFGTFETLSPILKQIGIETRNLSQSLLVAFEKGRVNPPKGKSNIYKCGWHTTWMGTEVYYRSSYELDFALELDSRQVKYDMECLRIKYWDSISQQFRCAIPDFFLPDTNEIIEIKSIYTFIKQEMIDKFKAYKELGYKPKLILDHKEFDLS